MKYLKILLKRVKNYSKLDLNRPLDLAGNWYRQGNLIGGHLLKESQVLDPKSVHLFRNFSENLRFWGNKRGILLKRTNILGIRSISSETTLCYQFYYYHTLALSYKGTVMHCSSPQLVPAGFGCQGQRLVPRVPTSKDTMLRWNMNECKLYCDYEIHRSN